MPRASDSGNWSRGIRKTQVGYSQCTSTAENTCIICQNEELGTKVASSDLHWMFSSILRVLKANNCFI